MLYFLISLCLYILLELFQRRTKRSDVTEVKGLTSAFPFPPKLMQINNAFHEIETPSNKNNKMVIIPDPVEAICTIDSKIHRRLRAISTNGIAVVTKSLGMLMDLEVSSCVRPDEIIREVFITFPGRPAMLLCFISNISSNKGEHVRDYTLELTRKLTLRLRLFTGEHISVLDCVADLTVLGSDKTFLNILEAVVREESRFCNPHSLLMGKSKYQKIKRATLASISSTELDLAMILKVEKKGEKDDQKTLWVLPYVVFKVATSAVDRNGTVSTTLTEQECILLVIDIARRFEKVRPTLLCTDHLLNHYIRQQHMVSQVICRGDIPDVKVHDDISQLVALAITESEAKFLIQKLRHPRRHLLINPLNETAIQCVVVDSVKKWTSDLLDGMSEDYKTLSDFFRKEISKTFERSSGFQYKECRLHFFSKGSVRAHVELFFFEKHDNQYSHTHTRHPPSPEQIEKAFVEGSNMSQSGSFRNPLQLYVVPKTGIARKNRNDVFEDIQKKHLKEATYNMKDISEKEVDAMVSKLDRELDKHDRYYGGNMLYWSAVTNNRYLLIRLLHGSYMTSEVLFESLTFCVSQKHCHAACLIIKEREMQRVGFNINHHTGNGRTILVQAVEHCLQKVVEALLSVGADSSYRDNFGWTLPMTAAYKGQDGIFHSLLQHDPDFKRIDKHGRNILHQACRGGNFKIIQTLLGTGSLDVNAKDDSGYTPIMYAISHNRIDLFQLLVDSKADTKTEDKGNNSLLHIACRAGSNLLVEKLLELDVTSKEKRGKHGWTPVMVAAVFGRYKAFHILKDYGASCEKLFDDHRNSLLHLACQGGNVDIVKELLPVYDINLPGEDRQTPMKIAKRYNKDNVVSFLSRMR